jgi:pimeloyl-ACP methyl ester carboxylesterase
MQKWVAVLVMALASCSSGAATTGTPASPTLDAGRADIGGYSLAYQCEGSGSPTVILEAGYTASGIGTFFQTIQPAVAGATRVCTYDRAGVGGSDARPRNVSPLTSATQAHELHALLDAIGGRGRSSTSAIPTAA